VLISSFNKRFAFCFTSIDLPEMAFGGWKFLIRYTSSVFEIVDTQLTDVINRNLQFHQELSSTELFQPQLAE